MALLIVIAALLCACGGTAEPLPEPIAGPRATIEPGAQEATIKPGTPEAAPPGPCGTSIVESGAGEAAPTAQASTHPSGQAGLDGAMNISYDADTRTIILRQGPPATLAQVGAALGRSELLRELAPGEWFLDANVRVERDAALLVAAPEVRRLKLRSDAGGFVWIKGLGGRLSFSGACVTSWNPAAGRVDEDYADGRSFVLARDGAQMEIRDAELSYLGYEANESYGVAWRLEGTGGSAVNSRFGHNFYGLYSYEVNDLVIRGNEVHHSVRYGIDPHTRSNRLLIEGNRAHHNGKHGIILAEGCSDSIIRDNQVFENALHGIVLVEHSNNNTVEGNRSFSNGLQGININNSAHNTIRDNQAYDNGEDGIGVGQKSSDNVVIGNHASANQRDGISLYSAATRNELHANVVRNNGRYGIYLKSNDNILTDDNQVAGNHAANIRRDER